LEINNGRSFILEGVTRAYVREREASREDQQRTSCGDSKVRSNTHTKHFISDQNLVKKNN